MSSLTTATSSELNVTVHELLSASAGPTGQLKGRGGGGGGPRWLDGSPIGRLVLAVDTACTCWTVIACQLHDGSAAVLFVCSLCVALAVFVSWTRGVYPKRNDAAAVFDGGAMLPD